MSWIANSLESNSDKWPSPHVEHDWFRDVKETFKLESAACVEWVFQLLKHSNRPLAGGSYLTFGNYDEASCDEVNMDIQKSQQEHEHVGWIAFEQFQTNNSSNVFVCWNIFFVRSFFCRESHLVASKIHVSRSIQVLVLKNFSDKQSQQVVPGSHVDGLTLSRWWS